MNGKSQFSRWVHLVHLTEEMNRLIKEREVSIDQLRVYLASVDEAFGDLKDPVTEFPSFALVRFCKELSNCLEHLNAEHGEKKPIQALSK